MYQLTMFDDEPLSLFEQALLRGSLIAGGKYRIYGAALNMNVADFAQFLKEEHGYSGCSIDGGFIDYSPRGATIRIYNPTKEEIHDWNDTAKTIKRLINTDKYLNDKEKEYMKKLQEAHGGMIPCPKPRYGYGEGWA